MMMPTPTGGNHHMKCDAFTGLDAIILPLCPRWLRLRVVAKKILRHHGNPKEISPGQLTFSLPGEALVYTVSNAKGGVVTFKPETTTAVTE